MTSKERTRRAIKFECPDRIPLFYFNKYVERGDIIQLGYGALYEESSGSARAFAQNARSVRRSTTKRSLCTAAKLKSRRM